jgi:HD-GYP domain-containing protein (c-di-GMP phosphodiesterase class II)
MQVGVGFYPNNPGMKNMEIPLGLDFRVSYPSLFMHTPGEGLKALLQSADDLLFVLDERGMILNCKARAGSVLHTFTLKDGLTVRDILPPTVKRKYDVAIDQFSRSNRFTLFEGLLALPPSVVNWYEFRLIPALGKQMLLFVWNVNNYRVSSWTVSNIPISIEKMLEGWSRSLYLRDFETEDHTQRVTEMTVRLAKRLSLPEEEMVNIRRGAQVHDIGKIAIPDEILLKTGGLTPQEWNLMRHHTTIAVELLKAIPGIETALSIPRSHHEKWDGSGYPDHLAGENIPLTARIFAFADVYDALTSDRPYRRAWTKEGAIDYIRKEAGRHFDPRLAPEFIQMIQD